MTSGFMKAIAHELTARPKNMHSAIGQVIKLIHQVCASSLRIKNTKLNYEIAGSYLT